MTIKTLKNILVACFVGLLLVKTTDALAQSQTIIWRLDNLKLISKHIPLILGSPSINNADTQRSVFFNGIDDGLVFEKNPVEGFEQFTIEVLLKPDGSGPREPRFIHFEDKEGNRGTMEMRINPDKTWYLDNFLKNGNMNLPNNRLTLIDSTKKHPTDTWFWVAMVYDGKTMKSFVNGVKELEGDVNFPITKSGKVSLGVRLNKVNWYKGLISEIRFHPTVLNQHTLQKINK